MADCVTCECRDVCEGLGDEYNEMSCSGVRLIKELETEIVRLNAMLEEQQPKKEQHPKKGHWQPYKYGDDTWHQCSACGVADHYINIVKRDGYLDYRMVSKRNFCPNCGADMREDGEQDG